MLNLKKSKTKIAIADANMHPLLLFLGLLHPHELWKYDKIS